MGTKSHIFLQENAIKIPIIQRDYVQGANRWAAKRDKFVESIINSLCNRAELQLDFIYGTCQGGYFVPFDGQQRLTTLILVGWLLLQFDEKHQEEKIKWQEMLRITYEARDSSREFCRNLFNTQPPTLDIKVAPSESLYGFTWYAESWNYDPTIKGMLELLDFVWAKIKDKNLDEISKMAEVFFTNSPIEFENSNLGLNKGMQCDDLYLKINARGKHLTEFENWKAMFIKLLDDKHANEEYNNKSFKDYFEDKIENDWCNYFWTFCDKNIDTPRIDEYFMNFYNYVSAMLWASKVGNSDFRVMSEFERLDASVELYAQKDNVIMLFDALDFIDEIKNSNFFGDLLFNTTDVNYDYAKDKKVNIFDECKSIDLDKRIVKNEDVSIRPQLLLWGIIRYYAKCHEGDDYNMLEFVRVWWGYLMQNNQRLFKENSVVSDIKYADINKILPDLNKLLDRSNIYEAKAFPEKVQSWYTYNYSKKNLPSGRFEKDIIPLQNHPWLLYVIHNFNALIMSRDVPAGDVYNWFQERFVKLKSEKDRVVGLLENGSVGIKVPVNGDRKVVSFGLTGRWAYYFTEPEGAAHDALCNLLRAGNKTGISTNGPYPKLYKFVHDYADELISLKFSAFDIEFWYKVYGCPLGMSTDRRGRKAEPYACVTVAKALGRTADNSIIETTHKSASGEEIIITCYNSYSNHYGICIKYSKIEAGVQMECVDDGWKIQCYDQYKPQAEQYTLPDGVLKKYNIGDIYEDDPYSDRVQNGVNLLKELIDLM